MIGSGIQHSTDARQQKAGERDAPTSRLCAYQFYRPSGVPWLSGLPSHWEVRRLRTVADMRVSNVDKHTNEDEFPVRLCNYVDVYKHDRITPAMPFMAATASRDEITRFGLERDDVLITKDSEAWDDIGVPSLVAESADDLLSGYHLALLRPFEEILGSYLARALQSKAVAYQFHVRAKGVTRYGITHTGIQSVQIPLPSLPEQRAIVRYLDYVDRRIRRYISAKRKLIGLLEEEKQAIVNQAVTRGLDPNVRVEPSGVEWLGDVPEHWERRRLKTVLQPIDRRSTTGIETLLSLRRDYGVVVYAEHFNRPSQSGSLVAFKLVRVGQLVVNRLQANNGLVFNSTVDGLVSPDYSVFGKKFPLEMKFLSDLLRTLAYRVYFRQNATGLGTGTAGFLRLYDDAFLETPVYLPPNLEQSAIIEHIDKATGDIDAAVERTRRQIALVQEYRTRLIADVVTGKLDVRDVAAQLVDETDDQDPTEGDGLWTERMDKDHYNADASGEELAIESEVTV